jgi:hypothetical protein
VHAGPRPQPPAQRQAGQALAAPVPRRARRGRRWRRRSCPGPARRTCRPAWRRGRTRQVEVAGQLVQVPPRGRLRRETASIRSGVERGHDAVVE